MEVESSHTFNLKRGLIPALFYLLAPAWAAASEELSLQSAFHATQEWRVSAKNPQGAEAESGDTPISICFTSPTSKSACEPQEIKRNGLVYPLQSLLDLSITENPHLLKLSTRYSGGGSGTLTQLRFWRHDTTDDRFKPAGTLDFSEQGEYRLTENGTLIIADYILGKGETHFSRHHFTISTYRYTPAKGFTKVLSYATSATYPSFDEVETIDVISHELPEIERRLN